MVTINEELKKTIERRARRSWKRLREGDARAQHRISDVTPESLKYRVPYTPDYYGSEKVQVVLEGDGLITIDPHTTGDLDMLTRKDVQDLKALKKHKGTVRAYKLTKADGCGPHYPTITYKVGESYQALDAVTNPASEYGAGLYAASLDWVKENWQGTYRVFACEFQLPDDLAAVPDKTEGKFRCFRMKIVEELDLVALGRKQPEPTPTEPEPEAEGEGPGIFGKLLGKKSKKPKKDD